MHGKTSKTAPHRTPQAFTENVPPVACAQGRDSSVVFRWAASHLLLK